MSNKENTKEGSRNLEFIKKVMDIRGYGYVPFAKRLGISPQSLRWTMRNHDDCALEAVERFADALQVKITPRFSVKEIKREPLFFIEGDLPINMDIPDRTPAKFMRTAANSNNRRLNFLAQFLIGTGDSLNTICEKTRIKRETLRSIFERDNINVSTLYGIAETYGTMIQ